MDASVPPSKCHLSLLMLVMAARAPESQQKHRNMTAMLCAVWQQCLEACHCA